MLEELNSHFKSHGRFINGSEITAGDCVVAPLLYQVEIVCNQLKVRPHPCNLATTLGCEFAVMSSKPWDATAALCCAHACSRTPFL